MRYTKQGVRDLNDLPRTQPKQEFPKPYLGSFIDCDHHNMHECHPDCCGHLYCPDCGLTWDYYAEM